MLEYLFSLFKTIRIILPVLALLSVLVNCFYLSYLFKGKKQEKHLTEYVGSFLSTKKGIVICETVLILGIICSPPVFSKIQNTNIGSLLEKEYYTEQYYVYVRPDKNSSKSYRLKADIVRGDYGYQSYDDNGEETFVTQGNGYFVQKVYWNNGGYLVFDHYECYDSYGARVYPGKEAYCIDVKDEVYYITLTTEKVK